MSPTPRTDEQVLAYLTEDGSELVHASAARELETELAAMTARTEKAAADTARLDWLQSSVSLHVNSIALRGDIRDAIDFAMKDGIK